jgi:hypothetical protein
MRGSFFNLGFTLYSLLWFYTLVGSEIFGGKINSELWNEIFKDPDTTVESQYIWLNFNDFASGLITLFTMMFFNNWQFVWQQFAISIDWNTAYVNGFFLTFMVMATYIIINILMAFVIDVYTSIEDSSRAED